MAKRPDLAERNRSVRGGHRPYEDREWMRERYEDKSMTLRQIAADAGCGLRTIARWMSIHGIATRKDDWRSQADRMRHTRRELHPNWKGGRHIDRTGYVRVLPPADWPYPAMTQGRDGYMMEHRLIMAQQLGRALTSWETVHHIDGDRQNNDPSNLQLRQGRHGNGAAHMCGDCGSRNIVAVRLSGGDA